MPGFLLHVGAVMTCLHASGQIALTTTNVRVFVSGMPVATAIDIPAILGCLSPQPCITARMIPTTRVLVSGQPALTYLPGTGITLTAGLAPQGPPTASVIQTRVTGM
jgi:hypothetical protein